VAAPPGDVYVVLRHVQLYPSWWPEVQSVRMIDSNRFETVCRSLLPYELRFETQQTDANPLDGVLEGRLSGDLEGSGRWSLAPSAGGTVVTYDQEVVTRKAVLNLLAPVARPAFVANHSLMMRHGGQGLRAAMAGYGLASSKQPYPG